MTGLNKHFYRLKLHLAGGSMSRPKNLQKQLDTAIRMLADSLTAMVDRAAAALAPAAPAGRRGRPGRKPGRTAAKPRRKLRLDAKTRALRRQQGLFMGVIRMAPKSKRAGLKALRLKKGYAAAIAAGRKYTKKKG
jgi:hypothetical protein